MRTTRYVSTTNEIAFTTNKGKSRSSWQLLFHIESPLVSCTSGNPPVNVVVLYTPLLSLNFICGSFDAHLRHYRKKSIFLGTRDSDATEKLYGAVNGAAICKQPIVQ